MLGSTNVLHKRKPEMLKIKELKNPRWTDKDHTAVSFNVVFEGEDDLGEVLVARSSDKPTSTYFSKALSGEYGPIAEYVEPEPLPEPVPNYITPRQLRIGLTESGFITEEEAREWRKGNALPAVVQGIIDSMPVEKQFAAEETAFSMSVAYRSDPILVEAAKAAKPELDDAAMGELLDQSFRDWSKL